MSLSPGHVGGGGGRAGTVQWQVVTDPVLVARRRRAGATNRDLWPLSLLMHCLTLEEAAGSSLKTMVERHIEKQENLWVASEDKECDGSPGPHLLHGTAG